MAKLYRNERLVRRDRPASRHIPYRVQIGPATVRTRQGDLLQIFRLDGIAHETADDDEINTWHENLNMFVRNIASPHVALWTHIVRRATLDVVPGEFAPGFARDLDEKYRRTLGTGGRLYVNDLYVTLLYRPEPIALARLFSRVDDLTDAAHAAAHAAGLEQIENLALDLEKSLARYGPERLSTYAVKGMVYSRALEFLQFLVNGESRRFPLACANIADTLVTSRLLFGREALEMRLPDRSILCAMLGVKEYPNPSAPGLLNELLRGDYECILTQSFACVDKASARGALRRQRDRLENTDDEAGEQIAELDDALNDLQSNKFTMGEHHLTLLVKAADPLGLSAAVAQARAALADAGCVVVREDLALEAGFWAQLPGNFAYRPRPASITSRNFVGFSPFHNYPAGQREGNHWGPAVTLLKTRSGAPYFFNYHRRDLGITLLTGQSGTGKTATQNFLASQAEKFGATGIYFDKDRGSEIFIRASGGRYFRLAHGVPTGFNPFCQEPTPGWIATLRRLLSTCLRAVNRPFTARDDQEIADAIEGVYGLPVGQRRFGQLLAFMRPPADENLAMRLLRWCRTEEGAGPLAWVFDNPEDRIDVRASRLFGFDTTEFLDDPEIRTPIMIYLWARVAELIDGRRLYMFIDEFWKALEDDYFIEELQNRYKTMRKQNWFLICATQSPADALRSRIAHTVIEQTATFLYLPNPQAKERDYTEGFNLTPQEYRTIRSLPDTSRRFLVKQGQNAVVCELDLTGFDEELAVLSGTTANTLLVERLCEEHGADPAVWLPIFYRERRSA